MYTLYKIDVEIYLKKNIFFSVRILEVNLL